MATTRSDRKEISIVGATFSGNHGAEAMINTVIARIRDRYPAAQFNVFSYYPARDRTIVSDNRVTIYSSTPAVLVVLTPLCVIFRMFHLLGLRRLCGAFPRAVRALARSNVLIDISGVSFVDGREKFLPFNILVLTPALWLTVPVVKLSQAMGPFHNPVNRLLARRYLAKCHRVFARGRRSLESVRELGAANIKADQADDIVFSSGPGESLVNSNRSHADSVLRKIARLECDRAGIVGFCPSSVVAQKARNPRLDYTGLLCRLIEDTINKGNGVILFPNATREDKGGTLRNNDLPVIASILQHLGSDSRLLDSLVYVDKDIGFEDIRQIIQRCDITVVSRFHAMVTSLLHGVPTFVIGWGHKYHEVMEQFGQESRVIDYRELEAETVSIQVAELLRAAAAAKDVILRELQQAKNSSFGQFEYLFGRLDEVMST